MMRFMNGKIFYSFPQHGFQIESKKKNLESRESRQEV
jgi:hypothetical protein